MVFGPKNVSALDNLRLSEAWAAFTLEQLGDLPQALRLRESYYARALALMKADPANAHNRTIYRVGQENAVRELSLLDGDKAGDKADYRRFFENGNPTLDEIRAMLARGWRYQST